MPFKAPLATFSFLVFRAVALTYYMQCFVLFYRAYRFAGGPRVFVLLDVCVSGKMLMFCGVSRDSM